MNKRDFWFTDDRTVEIVREGSNPSDYDVEYEIDYVAGIRHDSEDAEAEVVEITGVAYYADPATTEKTVLDFGSLSSELKRRIDAAVLADVKGASAYMQRQGIAAESDRRIYGD